jgi:hypothetical protein
MLALLPPAPEAIDAAELRAWAESRTAAAMEAFDAEATPEQFRDDGSLFHDRLPSEDVDGFNPGIVARAECLRPAVIPSSAPGVL